MEPTSDMLSAEPPLRPTEALEGGIVAPPAESTGATAGPAVVERLAIRLGSLHLLCAPDVGREVILPPPASPLPHTPAWLAGVANVRGALVPVMDLAQAFDTEHLKDRRAYLLISGAGDDVIGLLVDGLPVLQHLEPGERLDNIPPHPELLQGHVHGAYHHGGAIWLDVDARGVFATLSERIAA